MRREYFVMQRSDRWWVTQDGTRLGPYSSGAVAIAAAIALARLDARVGRAARVSLEEAGNTPTVFETQ